MVGSEVAKGVVRVTARIYSGAQVQTMLVGLGFAI